MAKRDTNTRALSRSELAIFCTQVSILLGAGITLHESLGLLAEDLDPSPLRTAVEMSDESVRRRLSLSEALASVGVFPRYMVEMVNIGEFSGNLTEVLAELAHFYEREEQLQRRVRRAVAYPLMLAVLLLAVFVLLLVRVLPMFAGILNALGSEMPGLAGGLMSVGLFLERNGIFLLLLFAILGVCFFFYRRTVRGREWLDRFKAVFPLTRRLTQKLAAARFAGAMTFLLRAGADVESALDLSRGILGNAFLTEKIDRCKQRVAEGMTIYDALYVAEIFPRLFTRMLGVGFRAGEIDTMMAHLSELYDREAEDSLRRLTGAVEPVLVVLLTLVVGGLLVSVMLPLVDILSVLG